MKEFFLVGGAALDRQAKAFSVNGKMIKKIGGDHINAHSVLATKNLLVPLLTKHLFMRFSKHNPTRWPSKDSKAPELDDELLLVQICI